jgi:hypothetical protein
MNLADSEAGNRFDSLTGEFETIYFGTTRGACYAETLGPRRPDPNLVAEIDESGEWNAYMDPGKVEAEWRRRRVLEKVKPTVGGNRYLDLHSSQSLAWLTREMRTALAIFGVQQLTLSHVTTGDRQITRAISSWVYTLRSSPSRQFIFDGIKYGSKYGEDLECWAVYDRTLVTLEEKRTIELDDPELMEIAKRFGLQIF